MTSNSILDRFAITDQVAFVTGGARGLGRAICLGFAEAGAHIVAVDLLADQLEETAALVREKGRRCLPTHCDVTVKAQVQAAVEKVVREFGRIDILVNNAGGSFGDMPAEEWPEEKWEKELNLNLKAAFLCSQAVSKVMLEQRRGKILNIGSVGGFRPDPGIAPYCVAKAGVHTLTKSLALEWGDKGIWVNCIAPGDMRTPMREHHIREYPRPGKEAIFDLPPAKRNWPPVPRGVAEPEVYVPIALFLVSPASNHITGDIISPGHTALWRT